MHSATMHLSAESSFYDPIYEGQYAQEIKSIERAVADVQELEQSIIVMGP